MRQSDDWCSNLEPPAYLIFQSHAGPFTSSLSVPFACFENTKRLGLKFDLRLAPWSQLASMAETLALAASIIGAVGFALQLWDDTKEFRKGGSAISTVDCAKQAASLQAHCDRVKSLQFAESSLAEAVSPPNSLLWRSSCIRY